MTDDLADLGALRCTEHLFSLVVEGDATDGHDARRACPVPGCRTVRIA